jgi:hypothetical protein
VCYILDSALRPTIRELDSEVLIRVLKGHTTRTSHIQHPSYMNVPHQPYCLLMTGHKAVITVLFIREAFQRKIDIFYWQNTTLQCHSKCTCFFTTSKRYEPLPYDVSLISFKLIAWLRFIHTSTSLTYCICVRFIDAFAKLRETTIGLVMSLSLSLCVCLSFRPHGTTQFNSHWI